MGFNFTFLCDLLSSLEGNRTAAGTSRTDQLDFRTIRQWFVCHGRQIDDSNSTDRLALLTCMFPERRPDRVFWLQATSLTRVIGRCLGLGSSRLSDLDQWRKPGGPDLGTCVENVMRQAENFIPQGREVTTEEIDMALETIASRCRFSGPGVRRQQTAVNVEKTLSQLYRRLTARDAKWLTRMILKSYAPVIIPPKLALKNFHFLLPHLLQFQNTFEGALKMLDSEPIREFPSRPDPTLAASLCAVALEHLQPSIGIKIGRPEYFKARSIKNCLDMANGRRMSVERKYDGEYCQIHVDLTNARAPFQIFSKSGKDSSEDRSGIFSTLEKSLSIGSEQCRFSDRCILEGELVVWSDKRGKIADFHKLRKFLTRSGTMIGVDNDSPPQPYEYLMIVFFDILLLDNNVCLRKPHRERRLLLKDVVETIHGRAELAEQEIIDMAQPDSRNRLEVSFARAISERWEGYVLKACDEPYFPIHVGTNAYGRWIKFKKDYVQGLGDTLDLALVGAYYDAQDAAALHLSKKPKWTHFLVGCLLNKEAVVERGESPHFRIIDSLNRHSMHRDILQSLNRFGEFSACEKDDLHAFTVEYGHNDLSKDCVFFKKPFVVELLGSGFEKPAGVRYYTLRFPRIRKLYTDRTFEEAVSFQELQILADDARSVPAEDHNEEVEHWRGRLQAGNGLKQYIVPRSHSVSSTCSSDSDSDVDSKSEGSMATSHDGENGQEPEVKVESSDLQIPENPSHIQEGDNPNPTVHLDETDSSPSPSIPHSNQGILVENNNLSNRNAPRKRTHSDMLEVKEAYSSTTTRHVSRKLETPHNAQAERFCAPSYKVTEVEESSETLEPSESLSNSNNILQSPLTTIPVYMSDKPSDDHGGKDPSHSGLQDFIKRLGSDESTASLEKSNPQAMRQGITFGIVLVNPGEHSLGKEIHRTADALSEVSRHERPHAPRKCKIFFLDSVILEQHIRPEDPKFCLQETWSDLGRQYYYACLQWSLSGSLMYGGSTNIATSQIVNNDLAGPGNHSMTSLSVSFEEHEILALGECTAANNLGTGD